MFNRSNFGNSPFLYVKTAGSGDDRVAYLKFDVTNWTSAQIGNTRSTLQALSQTPTTPPMTTAVWPVADSTWVEGNGTIAIRNRTGGSGGSQLTGTSPGDGFDTDNNPAGEVIWDNTGHHGRADRQRPHRAQIVPDLLVRPDQLHPDAAGRGPEPDHRGRSQHG